MSVDTLIEKAIKNDHFRNALLASGRRTLGDVAKMTEVECLGVPNLGRRAHAYLREALAVHGLVFRQETPEEVLRHGLRHYEP